MLHFKSLKSLRDFQNSKLITAAHHDDFICLENALGYEGREILMLFFISSKLYMKPENSLALVCFCFDVLLQRIIVDVLLVF